MTALSGPRIGVALGGGSARGLVLIPFIEAMDELGLRPSIIAGTSIGALIGAGWANGMPGREIREHTQFALGSWRSITGRIWSHHARNARKLVAQGLSMQFDPQSMVSAFLPDNFPDTFRELRTPLHVVAADYLGWHQVVFHTGELRPAIAASLAIPSLFRPMMHEDRMLIDGGVVNPLPLDIAATQADILVGIDVNGEPTRKPLSRAPSALDVAMGAAQIMMHQLIANTIAAYPPDVYVRPHVADYWAHEYWRAAEIISVGDPEKERFKRALSAKVEDFIAGRRKTS